jgi:hypothetical protein
MLPPRDNVLVPVLFFITVHRCTVEQSTYSIFKSARECISGRTMRPIFPSLLNILDYLVQLQRPFSSLICKFYIRIHISHTFSNWLYYATIHNYCIYRHFMRKNSEQSINHDRSKSSSFICGPPIARNS